MNPVLRIALAASVFAAMTSLHASQPSEPNQLGECPEILRVEVSGGIAGRRVSGIRECRQDPNQVELQVSFANSGWVTVFIEHSERRGLQQRIQMALEEAHSQETQARACRDSVTVESSVVPEKLRNFAACEQDPRSLSAHRLLGVIRHLYWRDEALVRAAN